MFICVYPWLQGFSPAEVKAPAARDRRRYGYNDVCTQESRSPFSWRIVRHGSTDGAGRLASGSRTAARNGGGDGTYEPLSLDEIDRDVTILPVRRQQLVLNALVNVLKLDPVDLQERAPDGVQTDVSIRLALRTRLGVDHRFVWSALHQTFSMVPAWLAVGQPILAAAALWGRMASCRRLIIGASQAANKLPKAGYQPAADYQAPQILLPPRRLLRGADSQSATPGLLPALVSRDLSRSPRTRRQPAPLAAAPLLCGAGATLPPIANRRFAARQYTAESG